MVQITVDTNGAPCQRTIMANAKKKAVVNAEAEQLSRVEGLVRAGRYRSVSEFMREAIADKLQALDQSRVEEQLERYCANGLDQEDGDLIASQAFEDVAPAPRPRGKSRAAR